MSESELYRLSYGPWPETVEAFVELLEAGAELGNIHLMTFEEHMMFCMQTSVQEKGVPARDGDHQQYPSILGRNITRELRRE